MAQVARYFSHAHLYLNGTNWLTSVWPLMMRLSAAFTRRAGVAAEVGAAAAAEAGAKLCVARAGDAREVDAAVEALAVFEARGCG